MRLRFHSSRSPYLRAGLSFSTTEPLAVALVDLDGARFRELLDDPILRAENEDDAVGWTSLDVGVLTLSAEELDLRIEALREHLPKPVPAPTMDDVVGLKARIETLEVSLETVASGRDTAQRQVETQLITIAGLTTERDRARNEAAANAETAADLTSERDAARAEADERRRELTELREKSQSDGSQASGKAKSAKAG